MQRHQQTLLKDTNKHNAKTPADFAQRHEQILPWARLQEE